MTERLRDQRISKIKERLFSLEEKCFQRGFLTPGETTLLSAFYHAVEQYDKDKQKENTKHQGK